MRGKKLGHTKSAIMHRDGMLIRAYYRNGATKDQLADAFDISRTMVNYILRKHRRISNG